LLLCASQEHFCPVSLWLHEEEEEEEEDHYCPLPNALEDGCHRQIRRRRHQNHHLPLIELEEETNSLCGKKGLFFSFG
jgi:hypothetical protein